MPEGLHTAAGGDPATANVTSEPEKLLPVIQADRDLRDAVIALDWPGNHAAYEAELDQIIAKHRLSSPVSGTDMVRDAAQALADRFPHDMPDHAPAYNEVTALRHALSASPSTPIPVITEAGERERAQEVVRDALMDSQYLAGAKAGWNAAQADDPEATLAALLKSREGHLTSFADAKRILSTPATLDNTAVEGWQPPESAPKDGTVLELMVDYTDGHSPLQDATAACTIGWNDRDNTGVDKWHIVGWDWCHDHIRDGAGTIRAWRPSRLMACDDGLPPLPQTTGEDVRNG